MFVLPNALLLLQNPRFSCDFTEEEGASCLATGAAGLFSQFLETY